MKFVQFVLDHWYAWPAIAATVYVAYLHMRRRVIGDDS